MAETTITGLPNATTPLSGSERVPMDQAGVTKDASAQDIANLAPPTNILYDPATRLLSSSTGADVTLPLADSTNAGLLTAAQKLLIESALQAGPIGASGLTMATLRILGRTSTGAGAIELIEVVGATLANGVLTITGTGGGYSSLSMPTGFSVAGSGTASLAVTFATGYSLPTDARQSDWDAAFTQRRTWDGGDQHLNPATGRASLQLGTAAQRNAGTAAGNVPILDGAGLVPSALLPGFVDDVLEYANIAAFPATGEAGKLYISLATNRQYRWSGSIYVEINSSPGSTDAVPEGSVNLYFTSARGQTAAAAWWSSYRSAIGDELATAANQAAARSAIGAGTGNGTVTAVTATGPITSTGGTTPVISTSMATSRLLGRSSAGTGAAEEIALGTNLSLSGNVLNATGGTSSLVYAVNNWITPQIGNPANGGTATASRLYLTAFEVKRACTISDLGVQVITGVASSSLQLGVYAANSTTGLPTGLPLGTTGNITSASAQAVSGSVSTQFTLQPGVVYWIGINQDAAITIRSIGTGSFAGSIIGSATLSDVLGPSVARVISSQAFGTWPDLSSVATISSPGEASRTPFAALRISALP